MNKLLIVLFGVVVAVYSFSIPVSRDALSEHSFHVESLSSDDLPSKDSSVEDSHSEVLPLEDSHSEDQSAASQLEESSQAQESHQNQPEESSQAQESHQNQPEESSQAQESHQNQPEESSQVQESNQNQPEESSQAQESNQNQPEESSQAQESNQNQPEESSQAQESRTDDQLSESSHVEESHSEDKPTESSPVDDVHSENHTADNPLATELPVEDLHGENSPDKDESTEDRYGDDSSEKEEEKDDEDEEGDHDLAEDYYDDQELKAVSNGLYRFSSEFYKKTAATRPRNLICSPLSVGVLLAMTAQGARGVTEEEMHKGLHLPEDSLTSKHGYQSLIDSINADKKAEVHLANAVFMNDEIEMTPEFDSVTKDYFRSSVEKVPFYFPDEASDVINYWVEEKTNGKVKNIVKPEDAFDAEMVLVNAVYFKGSWQSKFERENTAEKYFNIDNKQYKKVPTMYQKNTFNYGVLPHLESVYVELPYEHLDEDDELSMFIVLPKEVNGLKKLINASEKINFQQLHSSPTMTTVKLYMPKFKVRSTLNLQPVLEKMGMRDMFRYKANFTGITISRHLSVSKVVQKAYLEVNEEGSEAAAATAAVLNMLTVSPNHKQEPVEMHVDHPFMYVIYHSATNTVLFQGHVKIPALK